MKDSGQVLRRMLMEYFGSDDFRYEHADRFIAEFEEKLREGGVKGITVEMRKFGCPECGQLISPLQHKCRTCGSLLEWTAVPRRMARG